MNKSKAKNTQPFILAPAGSKASFLAAVAAGADAIYCGLKQFSARMEAKNFSLQELGGLTRVAHEKGTRVYVALNTLLKPSELDQAGELLRLLKQRVKPDALILQDLALVQLVRQTGFSGQLILSTLANVGFPATLKMVRQKLGIERVVIPRELDIDEIKTLAKACPDGLGLEVFVHGALCYGVSGRCYWSSYFGGKSGLRGRCVQPCRRLYRQKGRTQRRFSCMDLSLDVLVKVLAMIPQVKGWKIEGRKKGPHYVFYTVKAYQLLRDHGRDPQAKKSALALLSMALGRKGTHFYFLPQRPQHPVGAEGRTGSGLYLGSVRGSRQKPYLTPAAELMSGDVLRLGYEDEPGHAVHRVRQSVPKKGRLYLTGASAKRPVRGLPVFLIDRRERELDQKLSQLDKNPALSLNRPLGPKTFKAGLPQKVRQKKPLFEIKIFRHPTSRPSGDHRGVWLSPETQKFINPKTGSRIWWCLPPVTWPKEESDLKKRVDLALRKGGRNFILNAPWQISFFPNPKGLNLWAGPFCNVTNPLAIATLAELGFSGAIVSPELGRKDYLELPRQSPLPLGVVVSANWPLCVSRIAGQAAEPEIPFSSPRGEQAWIKQYDGNVWIFPNWKLDLSPKKRELEKAGYNLFVYVVEPVPRGVKMKKRPGLWNWDVSLF